LTLKHILPAVLATLFLAWLLDYLQLQPFLTAVLTSSLTIFMYGWDKYQQLPPDPPERPAPKPDRKRQRRARRPFPWRLVVWTQLIILFLMICFYIYWVREL